MDLCCRICGVSFPACDIRKHVETEHHISWRNYYQMSKTTGIERGSHCWNCGGRRGLLTPLIQDELLLPCLKCGTHQDIMEVITQFLEKNLTDKYYQEIMCTPEWIPGTLKHSIKILKTFLKGDSKDYTKKSWIDISFQPWATKEISVRNFDGLILTRHTDFPKMLPTQTDKLMKIFLSRGTEVYIRFPKDAVFDPQHHARYSIFNVKNYGRKTKRLKFTGSTECFKFWNSDFQKGLYTLFRLENNLGEPYDLSQFSPIDQKFIKLQVLRNRTSLDLIERVYKELCLYSKELHDYAFLLNNILLDKKKRPTCIFSWDSTKYIDDPETINISIL